MRLLNVLTDTALIERVLDGAHICADCDCIDGLPAEVVPCPSCGRQVCLDCFGWDGVCGSCEEAVT